MTIGVIITVYNLEDFAADAIRSVLAQTRAANRIIVVNDGSTDNSLNVIKTFGQVEIIDNPKNLGVLPSIILALEKLNTEIVAFLDGDDWWHPSKLKEVEAAFEDPGIMMVTHSYVRMDRRGVTNDRQDETLKNLERISAISGQHQRDNELKRSILSYKGVWLGSAFSIRTTNLDLKLFKSWSEGIEGHNLSHQDQPLAAFLILKNPNLSIVYIPKVLFHYRVFGENSSGSSTTLVKALRTLQRSRATLLRTSKLVEQMRGRESELKVQSLKLLEIDYMVSLYQKKRLDALAKFVTLFFKLWSNEHKLKELKRVMAVILLGPEKFLKLKSSLTK